MIELKADRCFDSPSFLPPHPIPLCLCLSAITFPIIACLLILVLCLEQEMSELLQKALPQLNYTVAESLLLLAENPEAFSLDQSLCSHQHCFILLSYFAYTLGDR